MGSKYNVFVYEPLVAGTVQMAANYSGVGIERGSVTGSLSVQDQLQFRRNVLEGLAATLTGQHVAGGMAVANTAAEAMSRIATEIGGVAVASPPPAPVHIGDDGVQVLEGVSAIVIDEDLVE